MNVSKFERDLRFQLIVEVFVLIVLQICVISLCFFQTLSVGPAENVVGQHSLAETSVPGERLTQLYVLFPLTFHHLWLRPFFVFPLHRRIKVVLFAESKLIYLLTRFFNVWLHKRRCTAWTSMRVFGTPTILAAVLWKRSEGGTKLVDEVVTYLSLGWKSWPLTKFWLLTSRVVLPNVLAYRFSGFMEGT